MGVLVIILCIWLGIKVIIPLLYVFVCWLAGLTDDKLNDDQGE